MQGKKFARKQGLVFEAHLIVLAELANPFMHQSLAKTLQMTEIPISPLDLVGRNLELALAKIQVRVKFGSDKSDNVKIRKRT